MQPAETKIPVILNSPPPRGVKLLNWRQVCERLGNCSRSEFYRKVQRGEFAEVYRLHNHQGIAVPEWCVDRYIASKKVEA